MEEGWVCILKRGLRMSMFIDQDRSFQYCIGGARQCNMVRKKNKNYKYWKEEKLSLYEDVIVYIENLKSTYPKY